MDIRSTPKRIVACPARLRSALQVGILFSYRVALHGVPCGQEMALVPRGGWKLDCSEKLQWAVRGTTLANVDRLCAEAVNNCHLLS